MAQSDGRTIQQPQRFPTPTDTRKGLAKQALSQLSYGPVSFRTCLGVLVMRRNLKWRHRAHHLEFWS